MNDILISNRPLKFNIKYSGRAQNKIYIPATKGKTKSNIRGFWIDKNKVYYDYTKTLPIDKIDLKYIDKLKREYKQEAIFYQLDGRGYCYYNKNKIDLFYDKKVIKIDKTFRGLKDKIKSILYNKKYNFGLTVYILANSYIIEVYYNG